MNKEQFTVVLVRPQYPFNIGATARAMHNMGLMRLVLISPACDIDVHAREGAASAQEVLARRETYRSLTDFYKEEGEGLRIAFTRREGHRRIVQPFPGFVIQELAPKLKSDWAKTPVYFMFGAEDDGLSADELEFANTLCSLPTFGPNGSYNLAQAVLLALYIFRENTQIEQNIVERVPLEYPKDVVEKWLEAVGFNLEHSQRRNAAAVMNALFLRAVPDKKELRIFTTVLQQNIRKLKERSGNV